MEHRARSQKSEFRRKVMKIELFHLLDTGY